MVITYKIYLSPYKVLNCGVRGGERGFGDGVDALFPGGTAAARFPQDELCASSARRHFPARVCTR